MVSKLVCLHADQTKLLNSQSIGDSYLTKNPVDSFKLTVHIPIMQMLMSASFENQILQGMTNSIHVAAVVHAMTLRVITNANAILGGEEMVKVTQDVSPYFQDMQ